MNGDVEGSVTGWLTRLKAGEAEILQPLWERYFGRLVHLARKTLHELRQPLTAEDDEDVALSAFHSFYDAARRGRFPRLDDREDLWRVLFCLTTRKAIDLKQRSLARKRGGGRVAIEADLRTVVDGDDVGWSLDRLFRAEPSPDFAAQFAEQFRLRIESLPDPTLRRIAMMKFALFTNEEIREELGCALRSVTLKLELIRGLWEDEAPP